MKVITLRLSVEAHELITRAARHKSQSMQQWLCDRIGIPAAVKAGIEGCPLHQELLTVPPSNSPTA